jgi:Eukaryotic translation initiation factor 3 subunit G
LKQQSNYPPGEQIAADKKFKAMQGEVKKLKEELDKLTQNRSASSTNGSKNTGGSASPVKDKQGKLVECFICKGNHYKTDCPNADSNSSSTGSNGTGSSSSGSGKHKKGKKDGGTSSQGGTKTAGSGLTHEVDLKTTDAIKVKMETLPPREQIPDNAQHTVSVDGTVTAKYCRHCGKFQRGKKAHFTAECRRPESKRFAYQPRAGGNMASVIPSGSTTPSPAPPHEPSGPPNSHLIQCGPRTYYDFSNMSRSYQPSSNLAVVDEADDEASENDWMPKAWMNVLSKDYGE